jgi:putative SOS response-associated peptidase YedK
MCSNYRPSERELIEEYFQTAPPPEMDWLDEAYPGYKAPIIRRRAADSGRNDWACVSAMFGMVPYWADMKLARQTYNARSETVATKPSFRNAWKRGQLCVIPAKSFYEPNYETGKAVRWEIGTSDGSPVGIAGIWEFKKDGPDGLPLLSFSMLTVNADEHSLMRRFHRPTDEKRMVVILRPDQYDAWLHAPPEQAPEFLGQYPAELMAAKPAPRPLKG